MLRPWPVATTLATAAAGLLLAVAPTQAQSPTAAPILTMTVLDLPGRPILPQVENPRFTVHLAMTCDSADRLQAALGTGGRAVVSVSFAAPPGVVVTGPGSTVLDLSACSPSVTLVEADAEFQISISRMVAALTPLKVTATAHAEESTVVPRDPPADDREEFTVVSDYYSLNQVLQDQKLKQCTSPCGPVSFHLALSNLGNAATEYVFSVANQPAGHEWTITPPPPLVLNHSDSGATQGDVEVVVSGPSGNLQGAFQLTIQPRAAIDPSKLGDPLNANFLLRIQPGGGPAGIPGPSVPLVLLAIALASLAVRRRA